MMKVSKAIKKVPGGKLLRVDVTFDQRLEKVKITGDFFLYPEEILPLIEEAFIGTPLPLDKTPLIEKIQNILGMENAILVGFNPEDLVDTLDEAVRS